VSFEVRETLRGHIALGVEVVEQDALHSAGRVSDALLFESIAVGFGVYHGCIYTTSIFGFLQENHAHGFTSHVAVSCKNVQFLFNHQSFLQINLLGTGKKGLHYKTQK